MLIISEVAHVASVNCDVVIDTFFQTEHLLSAKKAQVRAFSVAPFFVILSSSSWIRAHFRFQVEKIQLTNYTFVVSTKKMDKHPWFVGVRILLPHPSHSQMCRYFLLQRKPGVKSENGVDARKTFVPGTWRVLLLSVIFLLQLSLQRAFSADLR